MQLLLRAVHVDGKDSVNATQVCSNYPFYTLALGQPSDGLSSKLNTSQ